MTCSSWVMLLSLLFLPSWVNAQEVLGSREPDVFTFDYEDTDLRFVIAALAKAGRINVVYSSLPERPVTLRTNRPVTRDEIPSILRSVIETNGLEIEEEGPVLRLTSPAPTRVDARGTNTSDLLLFVYRLKHARADRVAATIRSLLLPGSTPSVGGAGLSRGGLSRELQDQRIMPTMPEQRDREDKPANQTPDQGGSPPTVGGALRGTLQVVPDDLTNSLLVRVSQDDWPVVQQAIEMLDLRPLQVLIEVMIAEVRRSSDFGLGVSVETPAVIEPRTGTVLSGELQGQSNGDLVLRIMDLGGISADVVLSALSARGDVNVLSRPVVLAQNNQEARLMIGSQRPFIQVFRALPTDAAVRDQVVQYRDVGTSLTIRPTINNDGYVSLELIQEVSNATNETQFGAPIISTREAATHLLVKDDQTVVIGGLIDRQQERTRSGIPVLKDIPFLGALFGSTTRSTVQTELFLFLTPHIIYSDEDADRLRDGVEGSSELLRDRLPAERTIIPARPDTAHTGSRDPR